MIILSNWRLTLGPSGSSTVIMDYDAELTEEPVVNIRRGLEVIAIPYGAPFLRPTKNDVYEISLSIIRRSATDVLARSNMLTELTDRYDQTISTWLKLDAKDLTDRYYVWDKAFAHSAGTQRAPEYDEDGRAAWLLKFSFTAVDFTKVIL